MSFWARLLEFICNLPPYVIVEEDEAAVHLKWGHFYRKLGPGFYWRLWIRDKVRKADVKDQTVDLPSQIIHGYAVEVALRYEIVDVYRALLEVLDYDDSLSNYTQAMVGKAMRKAICECVCPDPEEILEHVKELLEAQALKWGIDIIEVEFPTFTEKARTFRLMGDL